MNYVNLVMSLKQFFLHYSKNCFIFTKMREKCQSCYAGLSCYIDGVIIINNAFFLLWNLIYITKAFQKSSQHSAFIVCTVALWKKQNHENRLDEKLFSVSHLTLTGQHNMWDTVSFLSYFFFSFVYVGTQLSNLVTVTEANMLSNFICKSCRLVRLQISDRNRQIMLLWQNKLCLLR
jgi:hypothetical protein